jgi:hypothetical protein
VADEKEKAVEAAKGGGGKIGKIVAVVFGAVIAPVLVTVLVKWGDPALWKTPPTVPAPSPAATSKETSTDKGHPGRGSHKQQTPVTDPPKATKQQPPPPEPTKKEGGGRKPGKP